jgi:Putative zinc-finger
MNCAEVEVLICDYVDGTLLPGSRAEVERHLTECAACAALVEDSTAAVRFIEHAADVEPPQELVSRILFDPPWHHYRKGWFSKAFHAVLQPKFAMSMALTVLSFSMMLPKVRQLEPADLAPAQVWAGLEDRAYRIWGRTLKFYDNLKFVYQIQTTLREWQQQAPEAQPAATPETSPGKSPGDASPAKKPAASQATGRT